ncbi:MAG: UDP binding domain-containing protein, partial [Mycobacterium sp.]
IAVLGVTFKPNTDDMRDAPALNILPMLTAAGATVRAFDPAGMMEARALMDGIQWRDDPYATMDGAHALVILTEWNEFRALDLARVRERLAVPLVIDLRNIYDRQIMADAGFRYTCIGRPGI